MSIAKLTATFITAPALLAGLLLTAIPTTASAGNYCVKLPGDPGLMAKSGLRFQFNWIWPGANWSWNTFTSYVNVKDDSIGYEDPFPWTKHARSDTGRQVCIDMFEASKNFNNIRGHYNDEGIYKLYSGLRNMHATTSSGLSCPGINNVRNDFYVRLHRVNEKFTCTRQ